MLDLGGLFSMGTGEGGFNTPSSAYSNLSDRSPITIAPVGVNFGAMMLPLTQGSPENGGLGVDFMKRYTGGSLQHRSASDGASGSLTPWLIAGGAGLLALIFLIR